MRVKRLLQFFISDSGRVSREKGLPVGGAILAMAAAAILFSPEMAMAATYCTNYPCGTCDGWPECTCELRVEYEWPHQGVACDCDARCE